MWENIDKNESMKKFAKGFRKFSKTLSSLNVEKEWQKKKKVCLMLKYGSYCLH